MSQLHHASYLLLSRSPDTVTEWSASTQDYALSHFDLVVDLGGTGRTSVMLWKRSTPG